MNYLDARDKLRVAALDCCDALLTIGNNHLSPKGLEIAINLRLQTNGFDLSKVCQSIQSIVSYSLHSSVQSAGDLLNFLTKR